MQKHTILLVLLFFTKICVQAQCPSGSIPLSGTQSVNINAGQHYCIEQAAEFNGYININGGMLTNNGTCVPGSLNLSGGTMVNNGSLTTGYFTVNGTFENNGSASFSSSVSNNGTVINGGQLQISNDLQNNYNATVINSGELSANGSISNSSSFTNSGTLNTVLDFNNYDQAQLNNSGTVLITNNFNNYGSLNNTGKIVAANFSEDNSSNNPPSMPSEFEKALAEEGYIDQMGRIPMIIKFNEPPVFVKTKNGTQNSFNYDAQFDTFLQELRQKATDMGFDPSLISETRRIKLIANKLAIVAPYGIYEAAGNLANVTGVRVDVKFESNLKESLPIVGATTVHEGNNKGAGVRVGVIDSGIDYTHPALKASNGSSPLDEENKTFLFDQPGCKVCGGYDFGDNDYDPIDGNSHGTHVAGIIAGNNEVITGIAPEAQLYALKVCTEASGSASQSAIISALEWAVDPAGDGIEAGNNDDMMDIINLSMGNSSGVISPSYEAECRFVTDAGITFCVAAGNDGKSAGIASPGLLDNVITVGAVNKQGNLADFSNRGPAFQTVGDETVLIMKPDVVAPGVSIKSSIPGATYNLKDGTSMATPMVSGACALLKHAHPDWTNIDIKSALMNSADILDGIYIMGQGSGQINAAEAVKTETLLYRLDDNSKKMAVGPVLNFDKVNTPVTPEWESASLHISIKNTGSQSKTYTIPALDLPAGIKIFAGTTDLSQTSLTINSLAPNAERTLDFSMQVNASELEEESFGYQGGYIFFKNTADASDETHISWNVFISRKYTFSLTFANQNPDISVFHPTFFLFDDEDKSVTKKVTWVSENKALVEMEAGIYDLVLYYLNDDGLLVYIEDGVTLNQNSINKTIELNVSRAPINLVKHDGTEFEAPRLNFVLHRNSIIPINTTGLLNLGIKCSNVYLNEHGSNKYKVIMSFYDKALNDETKLHVVNFPVFSDFTDELDFSINYQHTTIETNYLKPHNKTDLSTRFFLHKVIFNRPYWYTYTETLGTANNSEPIDIYYTAHKDASHPQTSENPLFISFEQLEGSSKLVKSSYLVPRTEGMFTAQYPYGDDHYTLEANSTYTFGEHFGFPTSEIYNRKLRLNFTGQFLEHRYHDNSLTPYTIVDNETGNELQSGTSLPIELDFSTYTGKNITLTAVNTNFSKNGLSVTGTAELTLNLAASDQFPPQIQEFRILDNGVISQSISSCSSEITFEIIDYLRLGKRVACSNVTMHIKEHSDSEWENCFLQKGEHYSFKFPGIPAQGVYDIRIEAIDEAGNKTKWTAENILKVEELTDYVARNSNSNKKYCTIQGAISDASSGDIILINDGLYQEHLYIDKKLTLKAVNQGMVELEALLFSPDPLIRFATNESGTTIINGLKLKGNLFGEPFASFSNDQRVVFVNTSFDLGNSQKINDTHTLEIVFRDCSFHKPSNSSFLHIVGENTSVIINNMKLISDGDIAHIPIYLNNVKKATVKNISLSDVSLKYFFIYENDIKNGQDLVVNNVSVSDIHFTSEYSKFINTVNVENVSIQNVNWANNTGEQVAVSEIKNSTDFSMKSCDIDANGFKHYLNLSDISNANLESVRISNSSKSDGDECVYTKDCSQVNIDKCTFSSCYQAIDADAERFTLTNTLIHNSVIPFKIISPQVTISHATITDFSTQFSQYGQNQFTITNSILWAPNSESKNYGSNVSVENSIWSNAFISGEPLPATEPYFVDLENGDLHLTPGSPCIGAGQAGIASEDIEGNSRPMPAGSMPDIGAYESPRGAPLQWDELMATGSEGTTPQGEPYLVEQVGPLNTNAIRNEIANHPERYEGMSVQKSTIKASEKLYGKGCPFALNAQEAWYALGQYHKYQTAPVYVLISTEDDATAEERTYHADADITASNSISDNSEVDLRAGNTVTLTDGFHASGSLVHALIVNCKTYEVKSGTEPVTISPEKPQAEGSTEAQPLNRASFELSVYPNPTEGMVSISSNETITKLRVSTSAGAEIFAAQCASNAIELDLTDQLQGVYFITITTENNTLTRSIAVK